MLSKAVLTAVFIVLSAQTGRACAETSLDWMVKVYGDGKHNAFTDLIRWRDQYYVCFRHGASHMSMDGEIRVMRSADLKTWQPCATLDTFGDDRDPHFAATDSALYVFFGTWDLAHAQDNGLPDRSRVRSYFASTTDGEHWSKIRGVYEPGWWLWRVRRHEGAFYSVAYMAQRPKESSGEARLLQSEDGLKWDLVSVVTKDRIPDEADMLFHPNGAIDLVMRTCDADGRGMLLRSNPARKEWRRTDLEALIHSPVMATWKDRTFVAGRDHEGKGYVTRVWELTGDSVHELITLPSKGDTAYPGMLLDPQTSDAPYPALFVSWYSQHERQPDAPNEASIYAGRISIKP